MSVKIKHTLVGTPVTGYILGWFCLVDPVKKNQCGGRKTSPRTSTIVQFIFYFWSFEISENILRNQK